MRPAATVLLALSDRQAAGVSGLAACKLPNDARIIGLRGSRRVIRPPYTTAQAWSGK